MHVEDAKAAVGAALNADLFPQPGGAQELVDDLHRTVQLVAQFVQVRAFGNVVDLGRDGQAFSGLYHGFADENGLGRLIGGQSLDKGGKLRGEVLPVCVVQGDVGDHRLAV